MSPYFRAAAVAIVLAAPVPAFAHGLPDAGTLFAGLGHPLLGADHAIAMIAVGAWSALVGGRAAWSWPLAFVLAMLAGFGLGLAAVPLPYVEAGILASAAVLGLLAVLAVQLPWALGATTVGLFALFHGHAHGAEAPATGLLLYALGFALTTAALHGAGIGIGTALARIMDRASRRSAA